MQNLTATAARAQALCALIARSENVAAGAHFLVVPDNARIGVLASSCAQIFGLGFDVCDPFSKVDMRARPAVLAAIHEGRPSDDDIRRMVRRVIDYAPGSFVVVRADGRSVDQLALAIINSHHEVLVETCCE